MNDYVTKSDFKEFRAEIKADNEAFRAEIKEEFTRQTGILLEDFQRSLGLVIDEQKGMERRLTEKIDSVRAELISHRDNTEVHAPQRARAKKKA